jgi:hypothetical protein
MYSDIDTIESLMRSKKSLLKRRTKNAQDTDNFLSR